MKVNAPFFGLTFEGITSSELIILDKVWVTKQPELIEPLECDVHATYENGSVSLLIEDVLQVVPDMVEAMIVISSYYLKKIALIIKDRVSIDCMIDDLTASA